MYSFRLLIFCPLVAFLLNSQALFAQVKSSQAKDSVAIKDSTVMPDKSHFIIGAACNSALNYYGRVDSLKSSGIYPFIGVTFKGGL